MEEVLKERFERNEFWNPVNVETFWILELILELILNFFNFRIVWTSELSQDQNFKNFEFSNKRNYVCNH